MKKVMVQNFSKTRVSNEFIAKLMKQMRKYFLRHLPAPERRQLKLARELIVVFVDDKQMRSLNREYRKRDYVTDILSFESEDKSSLGELVLSVKKVKSQARLHRLTVNEELSYLLIHGVLHLLGFDHEKSKKAAKKMFQLQDEAFESLSRPRPRVKK